MGEVFLPEKGCPWTRFRGCVNVGVLCTHWASTVSLQSQWGIRAGVSFPCSFRSKGAPVTPCLSETDEGSLFPLERLGKMLRLQGWWRISKRLSRPTWNFLFTGQFRGSKPDPQIYVDLIRTGGCGEFSACFTELQKNFIVDRPTKLKSLIRLVKSWYREVCSLKNWFVVPIYGIRFPYEEPCLGELLSQPFFSTSASSLSIPLLAVVITAWSALYLISVPLFYCMVLFDFHYVLSILVVLCFGREKKQ